MTTGTPSWLFNARLNPVIPYAIRGAIWNQGYANMNAGITYYDNLHSLIRGWRELWDAARAAGLFPPVLLPRPEGRMTDN